MKELFFPLLKDLKKLHDQGGFCIEKNTQKLKFMPVITQCICDLPAKSEVQGINGPIGYFACGYCLHPGTTVQEHSQSKKFVRYISRAIIDPIRTHSDLLDTYKKLRNIPINGVKTVSCMIAAPNFDLINGFSIDYMHCGLLGIMRKLLDLWFNSKNHNKPFYIKPKDQVLISSRILNIKPTLDIPRKPGSLYSRADYKANELRTILLYYMVHCIDDKLQKKYVDHFQLFSSSIYVLLQEKIPKIDMVEVEKKLNQFADKFEDLYGKHTVTMNLHLLRHIGSAVMNLGPLWAQSAFSFETNNGVLVHSNNAKRFVLQQIAWKYCIRSALNESIHQNPQYKGLKLEIGSECVIRITDDEANMIADYGLRSKNLMQIFRYIILNGHKFTSKKSNVISTIDYFVELFDETLGAIKYYFVENATVYGILEVFHVERVKDQFKSIKTTGLNYIFPVTSIKKKLIYIKVGKKESITCIPNKYEKS